MLRRALVLLVIFAPGCGRTDEGAPAPVPQPPEVTCPVEGTRFPAGSGERAHVGNGWVEVCSGGCRYRIELDPARYLEGKERK